MSDILHEQILDLIRKYVIAPPSNPNDSHNWVFSHNIRCDFDKNNLKMQISWSCSKCCCLQHEANFGLDKYNLERRIQFMCENINKNNSKFPSQCSQTKRLMEIDQILNC